MNQVGLPFVIGGAVVSIFLLGLHLWPLAIVGGILTLFFAYFFRDPQRQTPINPKAIVSPADGQVVFVGEAICPFLNEKMQKLSIFMSIFDVHVNRMPYDGQVDKIKYRKGRFLPAFKKEADLSNEANAIFCHTNQNFPFIVVQIAGILARRIICYLTPNQYVKKGKRIGLICFGSKVDLYLPKNARILPILGHKVKAGETIVGYWE